MDIKRKRKCFNALGKKTRKIRQHEGWRKKVLWGWAKNVMSEDKKPFASLGMKLMMSRSLCWTMASLLFTCGGLQGMLEEVNNKTKKEKSHLINPLSMHLCLRAVTKARHTGNKVIAKARFPFWVRCERDSVSFVVWVCSIVWYVMMRRGHLSFLLSIVREGIARTTKTEQSNHGCF